MRENIINKWVIAAFDALDAAIDLAFKMIMKPFRAAIKAYCKALNKGLPAPFVGTILPDCLFIHSEEKVFGVNINTMSIFLYVSLIFYIIYYIRFN